jgi:hypothetical protein
MIQTPWIQLVLAAGVALAINYARYATGRSATVFWSAIAAVIAPAFVFGIYTYLKDLRDHLQFQRYKKRLSMNTSEAPPKTPAKTPATQKTPSTGPKTP